MGINIFCPCTHCRHARERCYETEKKVRHGEETFSHPLKALTVTVRTQYISIKAQYYCGMLSNLFQTNFKLVKNHDIVIYIFGT